MLKRPHYIAFSLLVLLALILLNLPAQTTAQMKLALGTLFLPLFGLAGSANHLAEQAGNALVPRRALLADLERLKQEKHEVQMRAMQNAQIWQENAQLRQLVAWQKAKPWKMKLGRIIVRDPANWWRTAQIDLGSKDGITTNLAVLTPEGLVGRIDQVGNHVSRVLLIGDPNVHVSAIIEKTRDQGIISAGSSSVLDQSFVELGLLSSNSTLEPGQRVITSGQGGIFPPGIIIGDIVDFRNIGYGLYFEARVKLGANLRKLEFVWVLLSET